MKKKLTFDVVMKIAIITLIVLWIISTCVFVYALIRLDEAESRLDEFYSYSDWSEQAKNKGWREECVEYETIFQDRFLYLPNKTNKTQNFTRIEFIYSNNEWNRPELNENYKLIESTNQTKCVKWVMVRKR